MITWSTRFLGQWSDALVIGETITASPGQRVTDKYQAVVHAPDVSFYVRRVRVLGAHCSLLGLDPLGQALGPGRHVLVVRP